MERAIDQILFQINWEQKEIVITQAEVDAVQPDDNLLVLAENEFSRRMNLIGVHGIKHWYRVRENGLVLSRLNGAIQMVVILFSIFHDCQRVDEGVDRLHGHASAQFLADHRGLIPLNDDDFELLRRACDNHNNDVTKDPDITVMTCWDADRLVLGRVGRMPNPKYLCTSEAKDDRIIEWAYKRSRMGLDW
jgi:uncharacterized protein